MAEKKDAVHDFSRAEKKRKKGCCPRFFLGQKKRKKDAVPDDPNSAPHRSPWVDVTTASVALQDAAAPSNSHDDVEV